MTIEDFDNLKIGDKVTWHHKDGICTVINRCNFEGDDIVIFIGVAWDSKTVFGLLRDDVAGYAKASVCN